MIYFTADTHFGHSNIIKHCNRPFDSVEHMDREMIININKLVRANDTLYHLGDFAFRSAKDLANYRDRLNCNSIHLILGNHDNLRTNDKKLFSTVSEKKEIRYAKQTITLCHYAMRKWNKSHYGSKMLFGHSHGTLPGIENSFDVGVDCWNFTPISMDFVLEHNEQT